MNDLTTTQGIVALAAAAGAVLALLWALVLALKLRRVRTAQVAVLGAEKRDLVSHSAALEQAFVDLRDWLEESAARLDRRMGAAEGRLEDAVAYSSVVRYDAYGEMSGRQSSSVALLDSKRSGVVVSSIVHRDQARVYVKQVSEGESDLELSPEERQAIEAAMTPPQGAAAEA